MKILTTRQRRQMVLLGIMMLIGGVMESLSVSLMLPLVNAITDISGWQETWYARIVCNAFHITEQRAYINALILMMIAAFLLKNIYLYFEYYIQTGFVARGRFNIQRQLMLGYLNKPYAYYLTASSGEIVRVITSDTSQVFSLFLNVLEFYTESFVCVMLGITIAVISPSIALLLSAVLLVEITVIARVIKPVAKRIGRRFRGHLSKANQWILQSVNGIKSVKVSGTEEFFYRNYNLHANEAIDANRKNETLRKIPRMVIESVTVTAVLSLVLAMSLYGADLMLIVPPLSAFVLAAVRLLPSMNRISIDLNAIPFNEGALDEVLKAQEQEKSQEMNEAQPIQSARRAEGRPITFRENLRLVNLTFSYENSAEKVLDCAELEIRPGQSVGIMGPSGAGKTTTMDIMLGLLKPVSGGVYVDGVNIEENMAGWLDKVAYIPQQIFLMDDTILANVVFGDPRPGTDDEAVWEALREAQMESFVRSLPEGLHTRVGEQGIRLSGGQRQRIGIARALYRNPEIMFFDEATSALDSETESAIMESINSLRGHKTLIIVAHRLTTLDHCDIIYRVENGKIMPNTL